MKVGRLAEITKVLLEEGLGSPDADGPAAVPGSDRDRAQRLRRAFERLGPTFVKFGQLLATRVDLFSEEFVDELKQLRSHVPPFAPDVAMSLVERELGRPLSEVFATFEANPVASASIAQVHRATLRDRRQRVAVKVQRPDLGSSLLVDLDLLVHVSKIVDRFVPAYHRSLVHRVAEEYAVRARNEVDFLLEALAMDRFRSVVAGLPAFYVPKVYFEWSTSRLLVMEWLDGALLDDVADTAALESHGFSAEAFCRELLQLQLCMSYEHGLVHGDTHPGNLVLGADGKIGLLDFGLHGNVAQKLRDKMLELIFHQASGRTDAAVQAFSAIFVSDAEVDAEAFENELRAVLAQANAETAAEARLTAQLVDGLRVGAKYRLKARSELFLVLRNLTIVEGIVVQYCPGLDVIGAVREIVHGILARRLTATRLQHDLNELLPLWLLTLAQRPQLLEKLMRLERVFTESKNLGDFLQKEGVLLPKQAHSGRLWLVALVAALVAAAVTAFFLTRWG